MKEISLSKGDIHKDDPIDQGTCPNCKGIDLDYDTIKVVGEEVYYPWTCNDCGTKGQEWYYLEFTGHNIYE
jgi:hypothetical protein